MSDLVSSCFFSLLSSVKVVICIPYLVCFEHLVFSVLNDTLIQVTLTYHAYHRGWSIAAENGSVDDYQGRRYAFMSVWRPLETVLCDPLIVPDTKTLVDPTKD